MTMITPSYLGETIEYSSLHACRSTLEDPTWCQPFPFPSLGKSGNGTAPPVAHQIATRAIDQSGPTRRRADARTAPATTAGGATAKMSNSSMISRCSTLAKRKRNAAD